MCFGLWHDISCAAGFLYLVRKEWAFNPVWKHLDLWAPISDGTNIRSLQSLLQTYGVGGQKVYWEYITWNIFLLMTRNLLLISTLELFMARFYPFDFVPMLSFKQILSCSGVSPSVYLWRVIQYYLASVSLDYSKPTQLHSSSKIHGSLILLEPFSSLVFAEWS